MTYISVTLATNIQGISRNDFFLKNTIFSFNVQVVDRRIDLLEKEGIKFVTGVDIGKDKLGSDLLKENDALLMATGSTWPRDLPIPGKFD